MLILNNAKNQHFQSWKWIPHKDYSAEGIVEFAQGSLIAFKASKITNPNAIAKMVGDTMERDNISFVLETVNQLPFKKDDRVKDDVGKLYTIVGTSFKDTPSQNMFLKSSATSRTWYLAVEGDE